MFIIYHRVWWNGSVLSSPSCYFQSVISLDVANLCRRLVLRVLEQKQRGSFGSSLEAFPLLRWACLSLTRLFTCKRWRRRLRQYDSKRGGKWNSQYVSSSRRQIKKLDPDQRDSITQEKLKSQACTKHLWRMRKVFYVFTVAVEIHWTSLIPHIAGCSPSWTWLDGSVGSLGTSLTNETYLRWLFMPPKMPPYLNISLGWSEQPDKIVSKKCFIHICWCELLKLNYWYEDLSQAFHWHHHRLLMREKNSREKPHTVLYCYFVGVSACRIFSPDFHLSLPTYLYLVC